LEQPQELLTQANAILGQGQLSLAKYLFIANTADNPLLDIHDVSAFLQHCLQRCDWKRDLHFQTRTTIDTLDYSGNGLNQGSKVVIAACGEPRRDLPEQCPENLELPLGFDTPVVPIPGVLLVEGPECSAPGASPTRDLERFCTSLTPQASINQFPLVVLCDDSSFAAATFNNFVWTTFTRSDPARDIFGIGASCVAKHWGCEGSLVIDARRKAHHAPPLIEDAQVEEKLERLACKGGPLHGII
jgi:4-hydroxy-3-polyprenylbenzoate decarboxylase